MNSFLKRSSILLLLLIFSKSEIINGQANSEVFEQMKYAVVLIETVDDKTSPGKAIFTPHGTGFWVADVGLGRFLVTNKHLFVDKKSVALRFYSGAKDPSPIMHLDLMKEGKALWVGHPDEYVDIAVIKCPDDPTFYAAIKTEPRTTVIPLSYFANDSSVFENEDIFFIGFPLGIRTLNNSIPIWRRGIIALKPVDDFILVSGGYIIGKNIYLIDAYSIGGNSGSPVFSKELKIAAYLTSAGVAFEYESTLVGIVSGHLPIYNPIVIIKDSLYSQSNAGLGIVHPAFQIEETIRLAAENK